MMFRTRLPNSRVRALNHCAAMPLSTNVQFSTSLFVLLGKCLSFDSSGQKRTQRKVAEETALHLGL